MSLSVRFYPEATQDLDAAATWYADASAEVYDQFADAVEAAVAELIEWPDAAP